MRAKYPKILPWLTSKAGVPLARAEGLWRAALRHATKHSTIVESPEYWQLAVDRLMELIALEARERRAMPFGFGPLMRLPAQLWLHGLAAQQAILGFAANSVRPDTSKNRRLSHPLP